MLTPEPQTQTITRCAAERGWLWWVEAFRMIKEAVAPWYGIGLGYFAILMALLILFSVMGAASTWISITGLFVTYMLIPCFVVGFVAAGWTQVRGETPKFSHLFSGFKADVKALMGVGAVFVVLMGLSGFISFSALGSDFATEMKALDPEDAKAVLAFFTSSRLWSAMLIFTVLLTLALFATWFAPMVVVFQHTGVAMAVWSSFKASLINWRALAIWMLVPVVGGFLIAMALGVVMMVLMAVVVFLLGKGGAAIIPFLIWGIELLILPLLTSLVMLSCFVAYCDIFHAKDAVFPRPPKSAISGQDNADAGF